MTSPPWIPPPPPPPPPQLLFTGWTCPGLPRKSLTLGVLSGVARGAASGPPARARARSLSRHSRTPARPLAARPHRHGARLSSRHAPRWSKRAHGAPSPVRTRRRGLRPSGPWNGMVMLRPASRAVTGLGVAQLQRAYRSAAPRAAPGPALGGLARPGPVDAHASERAGVARDKGITSHTKMYPANWPSSTVRSPGPPARRRHG